MKHYDHQDMMLFWHVQNLAVMESFFCKLNDFFSNLEYNHNAINTLKYQ